ncbi:MAG: primosomal protein N' [Planctomycetia bacterium]|nr:primosomal protein N' [Planctomycetia bacterium]
MSEVASPPLFVGVALDLAVDTLFTYRVPPELAGRARLGARVRVRFRGKPVVGLVAEVTDRCTLSRVLDVEGFPDEGATLPADLLSLARWVAKYYGCAVGEACAAMIPRGVRTRGKGAQRRMVHLARDAAAAAAEADALPTEKNAQARVLRVLVKEPAGLPVTDLLRRAKASHSPVRSLEKAGWVRLETVDAGADPLVEATKAPPASDPGAPPALYPAQGAAVAAVTGAIERGGFAPFLLLGVTGSGKTEVYLRAINACRARGRQAIVLVPEIALTPQTVRRFRARVPRVAVLHSAMTEADRASTWRAIRAGETDVVIGPRSAVFAPVPRLGLLVLDEEHETSFKQQNAPRYHARDVGLVRAKEAGATVILGSATPSLESYRNAKEGRMTLLSRPERVAARPLPPVRIVDLRKDGELRGSGRRLSRTLVERLKATLAAGGQAILFLNRRGFATSVACPRCGWVMKCPHCDVTLTYHRSDTLGVCHLCGHERRPPAMCPDCAFPSLKYQGAGTQTVEQELLDTFPGVAVARMDSDTMTKREAYEDVLDRFARGEVKVLLGTQMIAKGLHFPEVTLVGVVSADTALQVPDFRAAERTFALLAQVAGRTGRGDAGGEVVVQTLLPDAPAIRLATEHAYEAFAEKELAERAEFGYPPFRRLVRVVLRGKDPAAVDERGHALAARLSAAAIDGVEYLGPATPPIARMAGFFRRHLLIKATTPTGARRAVEVLRATEPAHRGVEEQIDVDPVGML